MGMNGQPPTIISTGRRLLMLLRYDCVTYLFMSRTCDSFTATVIQRYPASQCRCARDISN